MSAVLKSVTDARSTKSKEESTDSTNGIDKKFRQRVLILSSRGVTYRQRHLLQDLTSLLPHSRKDSKLDTKSKLHQLNELADLYNCNNILFFEARKREDLYMWMSKPPNGPTVKFHVQNLHTMEELHFSGNCLKGSRPLLSFDKTFESKPYLTVVKELMQQTFGVPKGARKSKPFVDHVMSFTVADGKIWIRCYQICEAELGKKDAMETEEDEENKKKAAKKVGRSETEISLLEIGPRLVLTPIIIQEGSFGGPIIYENKEYVSPNVLRAEYRNRRAQKFNVRSAQKVGREIKKKALRLDKHRVGGGGGKDWEELQAGLKDLFQDDD
ncbi:Ribosome biogenesis protein brx1 [Arthrobotrys musiformis]|uniref:Ribosome biogenesis protein brx1 n=1 Tax=Arthrobotrys musiformis TaxID=47236 RepID=A0AAV9W5V8_9PEZI